MSASVIRLLISATVSIICFLAAAVVLGKRLEFVCLLLMVMICAAHAGSAWENRFLLTGSHPGWPVALALIYTIIFAAGYLVVKYFAPLLYELFMRS